jgi:hypothetical protein
VAAVDVSPEVVLSGAAVDKLELELVPVERVLLATTLMSVREKE